jgi:2-polyprenyl-3-methyl-5-hydroxy-6-metoxy-1,4-benzoquinol methylase
MTTVELDQDKAERFAEKMVGVINQASTATLCSIGHQTGLFDTLSDLPPATSEQIAKAARLEERYVREWLGGVVVSGIVEYAPKTRTYWLPPEHAGVLTRAAGPDNLAFFAQYFALIGKVEQEVVQAFKNGGGVPYSSFETFQAIQAEETARVYDATLVDKMVPLVPGLPERLTRGVDVLDIGCGAGHAMNLLAQAYPNSRFAGYDISEEGIGLARAEAERFGLTNTRFEVRDVSDLGEVERYDLITAFDTIHDQAQPRKVLKTVHRALRPDGTFLMQDIAASSNLEENVGNPMAPLLYTISVTHCMTVSLAQGGEGLGTVWGEQKARELLAEAGFTRIDTDAVEGDILNIFYIVRKD